MVRSSDAQELVTSQQVNISCFVLFLISRWGRYVFSVTVSPLVGCPTVQVGQGTSWVDDQRYIFSLLMLGEGIYAFRKPRRIESRRNSRAILVSSSQSSTHPPPPPNPSHSVTPPP